jgi:hypothetical protein
MNSWHYYEWDQISVFTSLFVDSFKSTPLDMVIGIGNSGIIPRSNYR